MKLNIFFSMLVIVCMLGCLGGKQIETETTTDETSTSEVEASNEIAVLELSTPKTSYSTQETIPLELNIRNGKFDLLVPYSVASTQSAFKLITVMNSDGDLVQMKKPITLSSPLKTLYQDGKSVRCIQGFDMKAGNVQTVSLENLLTHYQLESGNYSVKVAIVLEVYMESVKDQHPEIIELQREINQIQNSSNPQFTAEVKKEAISYTQDQIDFIKEKYKEDLLGIYLPSKSLRGKTSLESNLISLTIE